MEEYAVSEVPICTAYRSPKVSRGSYSLCSRPTHSFSWLKLDLSTIWYESFHLEILRKELSMTLMLHSLWYTFISGSTATVILIADSQILVANVGDSKALLCTKIHKSPYQAKGTLLRLYKENRHDRDASVMKTYHSLKVTASNGLAFLIAKELTEDYHPDRNDERSRVESAGGYVSKWGGVARVNGQLAILRAIGDVYFKRCGVVSLPEINDWRPLSVKDNYLVTTTDGVFEQFKPQEVCDIYWELHTDRDSSLELTDSLLYSIANKVVDTSFTKGSVDNLAAVVFLVESIG